MYQIQIAITILIWLYLTPGCHLLRKDYYQLNPLTLAGDKTMINRNK